jgi:hypothetical protein
LGSIDEISELHEETPCPTPEEEVKVHKPKKIR